MDLETLRREAQSIGPASTRFLEITKKRLKNIASQIGKTVEAMQKSQLLQESKQRSQALLAYSPVCHKIIDLDSNLRYMNETGYYMLQLDPTKPENGKPYPFEFFPEEHKFQLNQAIETVRKTGEKVSFEGEACDSLGNPVWLYHNIIPVPNADDSLNFLTVVSVDITESKKSEKIIVDSLAEKEVLLKEIHHRVKNNMQVISGLIAMQTMKLEDEKLQEPFEDIQNRIMAMSTIHEILHNRDGLAKINLGQYTEKICQMLSDTYQDDTKTTSCEIDFQDIEIDLEKSYPIGLVVTELLSNAFKYAYPKDGGRIQVSCQKDKDQLHLQITDHGIGFPDDLDWQSSDSMGLLIVRSLVEKQLRGTIQLDRENGISWRLQIPLS